MSTRHVFYAKNRFFYLLVFWTIALGLVAANGTGSWPIALGWALLLGQVGFVFFIRPAVIVEEAGIQLVNPYRSHFFGWGEVSVVDVKYSLFVQIGSKRYYAFAAVAPSRYHSRNVTRAELRGLEISEKGDIRTVDAPQSETGAILHLSRKYIGVSQTNGITHTTDWLTVGVTVLLVTFIVLTTHYLA